MYIKAHLYCLIINLSKLNFNTYVLVLLNFVTNVTEKALYFKI